ncbi:hypothetical protein [Nocardiopsis halophila]|uniref:hypothetical protein n=1 Tax=Nocardiopsis halophila TaxID=141692 RepID=UPI00037BC949|nr:hypothetical protein [Nocardiopsis halophila]
MSTEEAEEVPLTDDAIDDTKAPRDAPADDGVHGAVRKAAKRVLEDSAGVNERLAR